MAEWFKAHAWKACLGETLSWVRIPLSPPFYADKRAFFDFKMKKKKIALLVNNIKTYLTTVFNSVLSQHIKMI